MLQIFDPSRESDCCEQLNDETVFFAITLGHVSRFLDDQGEPPLSPQERFDLTDCVWAELDGYDVIGYAIDILREGNCIGADSAMQNA